MCNKLSPHDCPGPDTCCRQVCGRQWALPLQGDFGLKGPHRRDEHDLHYQEIFAGLDLFMRGQHCPVQLKYRCSLTQMQKTQATEGPVQCFSMHIHREAVCMQESNSHRLQYCQSHDPAQYGKGIALE